MRPGLHDRGRQTLCRRLEVKLYHIYLHGRWRVVVLEGAHPVNMPLRQKQCESGVWQPQRCSRLWSTAPSQATQSDSAVMKSETHGGLYVIISGSLKLDREWLSWMVIVTLPPWETSRALRLLHRDIQSYSLLHIMELSSQRANGSDPFNLCQKHTDEEVPNARPLPWGRHTPPPGCSLPAAWFIDWRSSLILIHCSVWGDSEARFPASRSTRHRCMPAAHKDTAVVADQDAVDLEWAQHRMGWTPTGITAYVGHCYHAVPWSQINQTTLGTLGCLSVGNRWQRQDSPAVPLLMRKPWPS